MARLIDADALRSNIDCCGIEIFNDKLTIVEQINEAPTVDAEAVVRCRDCAVPHNKYTGCPKLNGLVTTPDFYCPFGKRKDGDGDG